MKILVCISCVPDTTSKINFTNNDTEFDVSKFKNRELPIRLSKEEEELHKDFIETLGPKAIWKKINSN